MTEAVCPICGRTYNIPDGRGRAMVETRFLRHKDACRLPGVGDVVRVGNTLGVVDEVDGGPGDFPVVTVHYASGREIALRAYAVGRVRDQEAARERFFG